MEANACEERCNTSDRQQRQNSGLDTMRQHTHTRTRTHTPDRPTSGEMESEMGAFKIDTGTLAAPAAPLVASTRGAHPVVGLDSVVGAVVTTAAAAAAV
jgi:hypothetical protein